MNWNAKYAFLMFAITMISYFSAIVIEKCSEKKVIVRKGVLFCSIALCFGLLLYFKYVNFILDNLNRVLRVAKTDFQFSALQILLPVGISFYTFQSVGYIIDVYRHETAPEKNPFKYALFVSFFPQLVAGPIERSKNLLDQLSNPKKLSGTYLREGLIHILIGVWQKVLIADNLAKVIDLVFAEYTFYSGSSIAFAVALFAIQIYCDFGGYSNIAIGSAQILGIELMDNFIAPYLATSVSDFWRRWHVSLTSWFRDYLYIPLGGSKKGKLRKYFNTIIVFFASGMWHGAGWNYVFWGVLNGFMIIVGNIKDKIFLTGERQESKIDMWGNRIVTFLLIDLSWFFFRAPSISEAFQILSYSLRNIGISKMLSGEIFSCFQENHQPVFVTSLLIVLLLSIVLLFLMDAVKYKTGSFIQYLSKQRVVYRWIFYSMLVMMIIIFGAYGEGYEQTEFIYFQF